MKIAKLTPFLAVSPQIAEADLGALAAQGFRAVVNNRPDRQAENQPKSAALAAAAACVGLEYRHVPVVTLRRKALTRRQLAGLNEIGHLLSDFLIQTLCLNRLERHVGEFPFFRRR